MSTCPENDIHSVYLDGELPEEFLQEYEAHVASCPECSKKLEALTRLKGFVHEDSASIVFSQKNLDDSFARLQAKMSYNNFKKNESENTVRFLDSRESSILPPELPPLPQSSLLYPSEPQRKKLHARCLRRSQGLPFPMW